MSVGNSIRGSVGQKIHSATEKYHSRQTADQRRTTFTNLGATAGSRYLAAFKTCADMHRNTRENHSPQYATETTKKNYLACVQTIMDTRGIKGSGENGEIKPEQFEKEFSPQELMKFFRSKYLEENEKRQADAQKELNTALEEVYPDDKNAIPQEAKDIVNAPAWVSDEEFLKMDEKDRNAYLESLDGAEQSRLTELLNSKDHNPNEVAKTKIDHRDPDPNTHPDEKDDFKIESGDIIEYLMKDVILSGTAWILNKPSGFVGALGYEAGHYAWSRFVDWKDKLHQSDKKASQGAKKAAAGATFDPKEGLLESADSLENELQDLQQQLTYNRNKTVEDLKSDEEKYSELSKHHIVFSDDGTVKTFDGKNIVPKHYDPNSAAFIALRELQNQLTTRAREHFLEFASRDKEKTGESFDRYTKDFSDALLAGKKPTDTDFPTFPREPAEFKNMWNAAHEKAVKDLKFEKIRNNLETENIVFSNYYAHHKLLEYYKQNKDNENCRVFDSEENIAAFLREQLTEASVLFYTAQKLRAEGKPIPSNEELITQAEMQFTSSRDDIKNNRMTPHNNDLVKDKINPPTEKKEREDLATAAQGNITRETLLNHKLADVNMKLNSDACDITRRRASLEEIKKHLGLLKGSENQNQKVGPVYDFVSKGKQL